MHDRGDEDLTLVLPGEALDYDLRFLNANDVEGIPLTAATRGRGCTRLDKDCRPSATVDAKTRRARMTDVQVAGEEDIDPAGCQSVHGHASLPH
jgi:hypothetical protein